MRVLEKAFDDELEAHGFGAKGGHMVDASPVPSPRQRLTNEEKESV